MVKDDDGEIKMSIFTYRRLRKKQLQYHISVKSQYVAACRYECCRFVL